MNIPAFTQCGVNSGFYTTTTTTTKTKEEERFECNESDSNSIRTFRLDVFLKILLEKRRLDEREQCVYRFRSHQTYYVY